MKPGKRFYEKLDIMFLVGILPASFGFSGYCGKKTTIFQAQATPLDQERVDLQQAYKQGVLSKKEYE